MAGDLLGRSQGLIGSVITLVVIVAIVAATAGLMFSSIADFNTALSTNTTGDTTADTIAAVLPILVGVTFVLGLVGLVVAAIRLRGRGS